MPTVVRTPRKDKIWAVTNFSADGGYAFSPTATSSFDLLADIRSTLGISNTAKVTVMRIVGEVWLGATGAASSAAVDIISCGIAWLTNGEIQATASLPDPLVNGPRQAQWLQTWQLVGDESTSVADVGMPLASNGHDPVQRIDTSMMRQQRNPQDSLRLVTEPELGTFEAATVGIWGHLSVMLALP